MENHTFINNVCAKDWDSKPNNNIASKKFSIRNIVINKKCWPFRHEMDFFQCFLVALIFNFLLMFGADFIIKDLEMIENEIHASYQLLLIAMCLGSDGKKIALCLFWLYLKKVKLSFLLVFFGKKWLYSVLFRSKCNQTLFTSLFTFLAKVNN